MAKLIEVEERDINYIFGKSKPYSLDVYQRDFVGAMIKITK